MMDKLRWLLAALVALVMGALGLLYGKKTLSVLRSQARAHDAKGRVLNREIEAAERKVELEQSEQNKVKLIQKADTLRESRSQVEAAKLRIVEQTGSLQVSDVELARRRNAGVRAAG